MGGGSHTKIERVNEGVVDATYTGLKSHPNFRFPDFPKELDLENIIEYVLDCAAELVSPSKIDDEDDDFTCESLASIFSYELKEELLEKLRKKQDLDGYLYKGIRLKMDLRGFWYFIYDLKRYKGIPSGAEAEELIDNLLNAESVVV